MPSEIGTCVASAMSKPIGSPALTGPAGLATLSMSMVAGATGLITDVDVAIESIDLVDPEPTWPGAIRRVLRALRDKGVVVSTAAGQVRELRSRTRSSRPRACRSLAGGCSGA